MLPGLFPTRENYIWSYPLVSRVFFLISLSIPTVFLPISSSRSLSFPAFLLWLPCPSPISLLFYLPLRILLSFYTLSCSPSPSSSPPYLSPSFPCFPHPSPLCSLSLSFLFPSPFLMSLLLFPFSPSLFPANFSNFSYLQSCKIRLASRQVNVERDIYVHKAPVLGLHGAERDWGRTPKGRVSPDGGRRADGTGTLEFRRYCWNDGWNG